MYNHPKNKPGKVMTQDEMKQAVAKEALKHVVKNSIIGVGTGSTANFFIDELATIKDTIIGAVASSVATKDRLESHGIKVFDLNQIESISVYIDGADESDGKLNLIKGGGGALTREKIVASVSKKFICIADQSKLVDTLGKFPLPVEVIPMAVSHVMREIIKNIGGNPILRENFITDNGNNIIDIQGLEISDPTSLEIYLNSIVGVVTNGLFSARKADTLLISLDDGMVKTIT